MNLSFLVSLCCNYLFVNVYLYSVSILYVVGEWFIIYNTVHCCQHVCDLYAIFNADTILAVLLWSLVVFDTWFLYNWCWF